MTDPLKIAGSCHEEIDCLAADKDEAFFLGMGTRCCKEEGRATIAAPVKVGDQAAVLRSRARS